MVGCVQSKAHAFIFRVCTHKLLAPPNVFGVVLWCLALVLWLPLSVITILFPSLIPPDGPWRGSEGSRGDRETEIIGASPLY